MRSKSIVLLALALGCGLVASIGISQVMERRNKEAAPTGETEVILVASHDINPNDPINEQNIKAEEWPKSKIQSGTVTKLEELENKRARQKIFQGEPILAAKLIDANDLVTAGTKIPKGYRVVAVRVDAVSGGGNLILPGDRVDVIVFLSKNPAHDIHETKTQTILQDIKVFAVDTVIDRKPGEDEQAVAAKTISLLVKPEQAEQLTLASELGSIRLVLRYDQDDSTTDSLGASTNDVIGGSKSKRSDEQTAVRSTSDTPSAQSGSLASGAKSLIDFINAQRNKAKDEPQVATKQGSPWKVTIMKGPTIEEVQIDDDGLPIVVDKANNPAAPVVPSSDDTTENQQSQESNDQQNSDSATNGEPTLDLPFGPKE
jgi:pilus assembly protein CpaB